MKKGCKPYKVNTKSSYASTKNFLIAKGVIDKFLNITDYNNFKKEVVQLTKLAKDKHDVNEGPLFGERTISTGDTSYYQAVANKKAFNKIDGIKKKVQPKEELTDYYMGDEALREQEERETVERPAYTDEVRAVEQPAKTSSKNRDLFLYLSSELNSKLDFNNPGYYPSPTVQDLINQMPIITKASIDEKKLDC